MEADASFAVKLKFLGTCFYDYVVFTNNIVKDIHPLYLCVNYSYIEMKNN